MSPSYGDGPSVLEPPSPVSSILDIRTERLRQVGMQPGMLPVLDCLDSLDTTLRKVNEDTYHVSDSERMRLKASSAVRARWPGRECDRGPLEETALQSVALLKAQLVQQMEEHPWLREAISGDELLQMVHSISGQGPFKKEDDSLREAIHSYVVETLEELYKDENESRAFFQLQQSKEDRLCKRIRELSEQLSSEQFLHNRAAAEETRSQMALQLMNHFLTRAKLAAKRNGRVEEVLSRKLSQLQDWHAAEEQAYRESELSESNEESKLQQQLTELQSFRDEQVQTQTEWLEKARSEEQADEEELVRIKQKLQALLKSISGIALRHQRRCHTRSEKERVHRYVQSALKEQELMLRSQLDLAHHLVKRWQRGHELHGQFVHLVHKAYSSMMAMASRKAEDFRRELRLQSTKFAALTRAADGDLAQQRSKMLVALQKNFATAQRQEEELEILERSFRPEEQTQFAESAFQESRACVKRQEEQVASLTQLRETLVSKCEEYEAAVSSVLPSEEVASPHTWDERADSWLRRFFYSAERQRLQVPEALFCDKLLLDAWTDAPASMERTLRHAASDSAIGSNFAGSGHTDLLAIRDITGICSAVSVPSETAEDVLGQIEDLDS